MVMLADAETIKLGLMVANLILTIVMALDWRGSDRGNGKWRSWKRASSSMRRA